MDNKRLLELAGLNEAVNRKTISVEIEFPFVRDFEDYHEVKLHAETMNDILGQTNIKGAEIDIEAYGYKFGGRYLGVFWVGAKPTKAEILELLESTDLFVHLVKR